MSDVYASSQPKKTVKIFNPLWSQVLTLESFNCKKRTTAAPPPLTIKFPAAPPCERDTLIAVKIGLPLAKRNAGRSSRFKQRLRGCDGAETASASNYPLQREDSHYSRVSHAPESERCIFAQRKERNGTFSLRNRDR